MRYKSKHTFTGAVLAIAVGNDVAKQKVEWAEQ